MICQTCDGRGYVYGAKTSIDRILRQERYVPCPDCTGGVAYCCDSVPAVDESDTKEKQK